MKIRTVMTPCPYTIDFEAPLEKALERMKLYSIRHLPVVKDKDLIGVVSERDLELGLLLSKSVGFPPQVGSICQADPFIVNQDEDLSNVVHEMADNKFSYALVTDEEMKFVGIFTNVDACRVVYMLLEEQYSRERREKK